MPRSRRPARVPEHYKCANPDCPRTTPLATKSYEGWPTKEAEEENRVHRVYDPSLPGFSIQCAGCGHYTVVSPHPPIDRE